VIGSKLDRITKRGFLAGVARLIGDDARRKLGAHWDHETLPPLGDGMAHLVQRNTQGTHPVDAQGVDRIRRQRQRQKLVGFLLVAVEKPGVPGTSCSHGDFELSSPAVRSSSRGASVAWTWGRGSRRRRYTFDAGAKGANLTGTTNPVQVMLTIGGDSGATSVTAHINP
jgi:hypothetical protein